MTGEADHTHTIKAHPHNLTLVLSPTLGGKTIGLSPHCATMACVLLTLYVPLPVILSLFSRERLREMLSRSGGAGVQGASPSKTTGVSRLLIHGT
jgi:hypothetical protein